MHRLIAPLSMAVLGGLLPSVGAQQQTLPADMVAAFAPAGPGQIIWAQEFWLPVQASAGFVNGRVSYDNSTASGNISIRWFYAATGASARTAVQTIELSMRPTAVARRTGTTDTLYIVGWSDRTGRVMVESCTFGQFALGSATPQGGGPTVSTLSLPSATRVVEWVSEPGELPPIWDAACEVYGNELLLLARGSPTSLYSLDLDDLSLTVLIDSTAYPTLEGHRMISIARHGADGLAAITERRRTWDHMAQYSGPDFYLMLRDTNLDGTFDIIGPEPTHGFYTTYPPPWDNKYAEP